MKNSGIQLDSESSLLYLQEPRMLKESRFGMEGRSNNKIFSLPILCDTRTGCKWKKKGSAGVFNGENIDVDASGFPVAADIVIQKSVLVVVE